MIDTDLIQHLVELDTAAKEKVYTGNAPQGVNGPLIVVRRSAGEQPLTLGGTKLFERAQFDVNVITDSYPTAYPVSNAIKAALHGFRGLLGGTGGTDVKSCRCVSFPSDQSEIDGDRIVRWVQSSYLFVYSED
jgi:hypothetical protein